MLGFATAGGWGLLGSAAVGVDFMGFGGWTTEWQLSWTK